MLKKLPLFVRKFIVDFFGTAIPVLFLLNFAGATNDPRAFLLTAGAAIGTALLSAARRVFPAFIAWLDVQLNVSEDTSVTGNSGGATPSGG